MAKDEAENIATWKRELRRDEDIERDERHWAVTCQISGPAFTRPGNLEGKLAVAMSVLGPLGFCSRDGFSQSQFFSDSVNGVRFG